jgi:hypothetical protein
MSKHAVEDSDKDHDDAPERKKPMRELNPHSILASQTRVRLFAVISCYDGTLRCIFDSKDDADFYIELVQRYCPGDAGECTIEERTLNSHDMD